MPIYEYRCQKCGDFEVTQRITEDYLERCPTCGKNVKRLISNTSFHLKGTGWYLTDYARKGKPDGDGHSGAKASTSSTSSEKTVGEKKSAEHKSSEKSSESGAS